MRRLATLVLALCLASLPGCQAVRDVVFGSLSERYNTSLPRGERRAAYDEYVRENVDR